MCIAANQAQVEEEYRLAKATYKQAKAAAKALRKEEDAAIKAARKMAKAERKAAEKAVLCTAVAQPPLFGLRPDATETDVANVVVCGGKTCKKMGSDVVVELLRKKEGEVGGVRGGAPCMKMCGGGGPTLRVGGEEVKLDLRNAVLAAILGGQSAD